MSNIKINFNDGNSAIIIFRDVITVPTPESISIRIDRKLQKYFNWDKVQNWEVL